MTIYSAQNPDNLVDFNSVMNGSDNCHIFKNFITFKVGSFRKQAMIWGPN